MEVLSTGWVQVLTLNMVPYVISLRTERESLLALYSSLQVVSKEPEHPRPGGNLNTVITTTNNNNSAHD